MEVFGYVISMAILPYLDSLFPEWEFLVRLVKKAIVCQEVSEVKNMVTFCLWELMSPICFGGLAGKEREVIEVFLRLKADFTVLNDHVLEDKSWLPGDKFAADIAIYLMFNFFV